MPVLPQAVLGLPRRESKLEIHKEKSTYDLMNYSQIFIIKKGQPEKIIEFSDLVALKKKLPNTSFVPLFTSN